MKQSHTHIHVHYSAQSHTYIHTYTYITQHNHLHSPTYTREYFAHTHTHTHTPVMRCVIRYLETLANFLILKKNYGATLFTGLFSQVRPWTWPTYSWTHSLVGLVGLFSRFSRSLFTQVRPWTWPTYSWTYSCRSNLVSKESYVSR